MMLRVKPTDTSKEKVACPSGGSPPIITHTLGSGGVIIGS